MKYIFKTISRNFIRKPVTNLINLLGLAISFSMVIIISVYCYSELTTDGFHKNGDRVYLYGLADHFYTPGVLKEHIDINVPGVESTVRVGGTWEPPVFQVEGKEPVTSDLVFADEGFFKLFTYTPVEGSLETALQEPMTIIITKTLSEKLFGRETAVGKNIKLNNDKSLKVSAVIEDPKANSCLIFSALASIATRKIVQENGGEYTEWGWCDFQTFLLLKNGANPDESTKTILSVFPAESQKDYKNVILTPLRELYFSKFDLFGSNFLISGDKKKVLILVMVAFLVLIIALINFQNISSSQWQEKVRQTGVMKVIGARRSNIFLNILAESYIFFFTALILAVEIVSSVTPFISRYTGIHYNSSLTYSPEFIFIALVIILILSILLSIIPAIKISSSRAVDNLKKSLSPDKTNFSLRGVFVIIQFTIAIVLIAFTLLVQKQVRFGSDNLGFSQNNIIGIKITDQLNQKKDVLRNLLKEESSIKRISFSQYYPGKIISYWGSQLDQNGEKKQINFDTFSADEEFFKILGLQLVRGRLFSDSISSDRKKIVVNETFLRENKIPNPIGATIMEGMMNEKPTQAEIIGVVKDFHYKPVNVQVSSLAIRNDYQASYCITEIKTDNFKTLSTTINDIRKTCSELSPSFPVEVSFFDKAVKNMYQSELRFRRTFSLLAGCAIVVCSLGILAISIFGCQRRIKEIGIRKVNGARISEILIMLNEEFIKWVGIAFVISVPISWYIMHKWLSNFAYKTEISWWVFAISGLMALIIALVTVSWQSWRAATRNPVEALRYE